MELNKKTFADKFYKSQFEIYGITRYKDNEIDINVSIMVQSGLYEESYPKIINISEKFKEDKPHCMQIELYKYRGNDILESWGLNTCSDYIVYFTPNYIYVVDSLDLKQLTNNIKNDVLKKINDPCEFNCQCDDFNISLIDSQNTEKVVNVEIDWRSLMRNNIDVYKYKVNL